MVKTDLRSISDPGRREPVPGIRSFLLWTVVFLGLSAAGFSRTFAQEQGIGPGPTFTDVAGEAGLGDQRGFRLIWGDFDSDGYCDIAVVHPGQGRVDAWRGEEYPIQGLLLNKGKGTRRRFEDATEASGLCRNRNPKVKGQGCQVMAAADVDNDGDLDLFSGSYNYPFPPGRGESDNGDRNEIFLNNGKARFTMVLLSGLGRHATTTSSAVYCDVDNDGLVDIFIGNWYETYPPRGLVAQQNKLYMGLGSGIFKDATAEMGLTTKKSVGRTVSHRPTYGLSHCDFNNDGWQDLLVCNYGRRANRLWMNVNGEKFIDVAGKMKFDGDAHRSDRHEPPFRQHGNTFAAQCADYDNDGDIDIFLAQTTHADPRRRHADRSVLLRNKGREREFAFEHLPFETLPRASLDRIGEWGDHYAGWLDFDNDGLLDLVVAPSSYRHQALLLFRQKSGHRFEEIGLKAGIRIPDPHGLALADYDRDGDVDILCCEISRSLDKKNKGRIHLFRNDVGNRNSWLVIKLKGRGKKGGSNACAIGARVTVKSGDLVQMREVYGGGGHNTAQDSLDLEFGFGSRTKIDLVEVRWPNKEHTVQEFTDMKVNRYVVLTEGEAEPDYE